MLIAVPSQEVSSYFLSLLATSGLSMLVSWDCRVCMMVLLLLSHSPGGSFCVHMEAYGK